MLNDDFSNLLESINTSVANRMFEIIHLYPTRESIDTEIFKLRQTLPKARESVQRVRKLKLVAEDVDKLGMRVVGFDTPPVDGAEVFIFDSEQHPAEGWGMKSPIIEDGEYPLGGGYPSSAKRPVGSSRTLDQGARELFSKRLEDLTPEEREDVEAWMRESKTNEKEVDRFDAEQTMKPQEEDSEVLVPDAMEDYSEEGAEEKGSKSSGTENELIEVPDEKLDHGVKYESTEPLHLCNACFKTFRNTESKCTKCDSIDVDRLVEELDDCSVDALVPSDDNVEVIALESYNKARDAGKSREEATQIAAKKINVEAPTMRNILLKRGVTEEKGNVGLLKNIYDVKFTKDGKEDQTRYMGFDADDVKREMEKNPKIKVQSAVKVKESAKEDSNPSDFNGSPTLSEERYEVWYRDNNNASAGLKKFGKYGVVSDSERGAADHVRATLDEEAPGNEFEIMKVELKDKANEKLSVEQMKNLRAPVLEFNYAMATDPSVLMKDLAKTDYFGRTMVGTVLKLIDGRGHGTTFAKDDDNQWKPWSGGIGFVDWTGKESKVEEQDYSTAGKGIEDAEDAKEIARKKEGQVVQDEEDENKWQVIVKKEP